MYAFRARFTASVNARDVIVAPVMASMSPPSCLTARGDDVPVMLWALSLSVERNHRSMRAPSPGVSEWERTLKPLTAPSELNPTSKVIRPLKPASEYVSIAAPTGVPANVAGSMFSQHTYSGQSCPCQQAQRSQRKSHCQRSRFHAVASFLRGENRVGRI